VQHTWFLAGKGVGSGDERLQMHAMLHDAWSDCGNIMSALGNAELSTHLVVR
jgi:hypothetical protein